MSQTGRARPTPERGTWTVPPFGGSTDPGEQMAQAWAAREDVHDVETLPELVDRMIAWAQRQGSADLPPFLGVVQRKPGPAAKAMGVTSGRAGMIVALPAHGGAATERNVRVMLASLERSGLPVALAAIGNEAWSAAFPPWAEQSSRERRFLRELETGTRRVSDLPERYRQELVAIYGQDRDSGEEAFRFYRVERHRGKRSLTPWHDDTDPQGQMLTRFAPLFPGLPTKHAMPDDVGAWWAERNRRAQNGSDPT